MVADYYDYEMNCVERHVFNSDGANWFQKNMVPDYIFQLDLTTGTRVLRAVDDEELRALILRRLSQKWVKKALAVVEASIPAICGVPCEAGRPPRGPRQLIPP